MYNKTETPAQIIFNRRYMCQVQHMHTLSDAKMNIFGISTSGDRNIDDALLRSWVHVQLTIANMVELHSQGIPLIVTNPPQCVEIYEILKKHISNWHSHVTNSINVGKVPVDDLRKMDEFAAAIFPKACQFKKPEELKMDKGLQELLGRGQKMFKVNPRISDPTPIKIKQNPVEIKHDPLAGAIAREFGNKTRV